jgi:hypothetical protein
VRGEGEVTSGNIITNVSRALGFPELGFTAASTNIGTSATEEPQRAPSRVDIPPLLIRGSTARPVSVVEPSSTDPSKNTKIDLEGYAGPYHDMKTMQIFSSCIVRPPIDPRATYPRYPFVFLVTKASVKKDSYAESAASNIGTSDGYQRRFLLAVSPGVGGVTEQEDVPYSMVLDFSDRANIAGFANVENEARFFGYYGVAASSRLFSSRTQQQQSGTRFNDTDPVSVDKNIANATCTIKIAVPLDNYGIISIHSLSYKANATPVNPKTKPNPLLEGQLLKIKPTYVITAGGTYKSARKSAKPLVVGKENDIVTSRFALSNGSMSGDGTLLSAMIVEPNGYNISLATIPSPVHYCKKIATYGIAGSLISLSTKVVGNSNQGSSGRGGNLLPSGTILGTTPIAVIDIGDQNEWSFINVSMSYDGTKMICVLAKDSQLAKTAFPGEPDEKPLSRTTGAGSGATAKTSTTTTTRGPIGTNSDPHDATTMPRDAADVRSNVRALEDPTVMPTQQQHESTITKIKWRTYSLIAYDVREDEQDQITSFKGVGYQWVLTDWNETTSPDFAATDGTPAVYSGHGDGTGAAPTAAAAATTDPTADPTRVNSSNVSAGAIYQMTPLFRKDMPPDEDPKQEMTVLNLFRSVNFGRQWWRYNIADISQTGRRIAVLVGSNSLGVGTYLRTYSPSTNLLTGISKDGKTFPSIGDMGVRVEYVLAQLNGAGRDDTSPTDLDRNGGTYGVVVAQGMDSYYQFMTTGVRFLEPTGVKMTWDTLLQSVGAVIHEGAGNPNDSISRLNDFLKEYDVNRDVGEITDEVIASVNFIARSFKLGEIYQVPQKRSLMTIFNDLGGKQIYAREIHAAIRSLEDVADRSQFPERERSLIVSYPAFTAERTTAGASYFAEAITDNMAAIKNFVSPKPEVTEDNSFDATADNIVQDYDNSYSKLQAGKYSVTNFYSSQERKLNRIEVTQIEYNHDYLVELSKTDPGRADRYLKGPKAYTFSIAGATGIYVEPDALDGDYGDFDTTRAGPMPSLGAFPPGEIKKTVAEIRNG